MSTPSTAFGGMKSTVQPLSRWDESARRSARSVRRSIGERSIDPMRGVRNMRSASSSGRLDGRLSTSTTAERSGGPTKWGVSTSEVGEGIDIRVAVVLRVAAVGRVVKSGEQLSTVQLLRGVVMA